MLTKVNTFGSWTINGLLKPSFQSLWLVIFCVLVTKYDKIPRFCVHSSMRIWEHLTFGSNSHLGSKKNRWMVIITVMENEERGERRERGHRTPFKTIAFVSVWNPLRNISKKSVFFFSFSKIPFSAKPKYEFKKIIIQMSRKSLNENHFF